MTSVRVSSERRDGPIVRRQIRCNPSVALSNARANERRKPGYDAELNGGG